MTNCSFPSNHHAKQYLISVSSTLLIVGAEYKHESINCLVNKHIIFFSITCHMLTCGASPKHKHRLVLHSWAFFIRSLSPFVTQQTSCCEKALARKQE